MRLLLELRWATVTICTVGYGDIVPTTVLGKFFASLVMLIGYGLIAVPTLIGTFQTHRTLGQAGRGIFCLLKSVLGFVALARLPSSDRKRSKSTSWSSRHVPRTATPRGWCSPLLASRCSKKLLGTGPGRTRTAPCPLRTAPQPCAGVLA